MNEKPPQDIVRNVELYTFQAQVCHGCLTGTSGECHTPGCFYWLHAIDDVPHDVLFAYVIDAEHPDVTDYLAECRDNGEAPEHDGEVA